MKTEPTESLKNLIREVFDAYDSDGHDIENIVDYESAEKAVRSAFGEGQSNPKIKQLEWVEVYKSIFNTDTSFKYSYEIHVNDDGSTILFDSSAGKPKRFINLKDAKSAAQADFEKRIKECLDL